LLFSGGGEKRLSEVLDREALLSKQPRDLKKKKGVSKAFEREGEMSEKPRASSLRP